jgi:hypothetical protein
MNFPSFDTSIDASVGTPTVNEVIKDSEINYEHTLFGMDDLGQKATNLISDTSGEKCIRRLYDVVSKRRRIT